MKTSIAFATLLVTLAAASLHASIIAGPITNPENGHDYYLLSPDTWTASEAEAENLGGTLAIVNDAREQEWIEKTFGSYGGTNRNLWIGLHRKFPGGPFAWITDERVSYVNWDKGQPDNNGGNDNYVHMFSNAVNRTPGAWDDLPNLDSVDGNPICGVVEVPGKVRRELTKKEKSLIGTWYASGDENHPCWIAGTKNMLFELYDQRASRLVYTSEGSVLALTPQDGICGEIIGDKILWSNGTWWSRTPAKFERKASVE